MQMQPPPAQPERLTPQQQAIRSVRDRYERGEIAFDAFKQALDDLLVAKTPEECRMILDALPTPDHARALQALDGAMAVATSAPQVPAPVATSGPRTGWLFMLMGELRRTQRRWRLAPVTNCLLMMGEVKLDLNLATIPQRGVLNLYGLMGSMTIYVPRNVRVRVRALTLLGEATALGENSGGILAMGHADSDEFAEPAPDGTEPMADLTIRAFMCMGEIKVVQTDVSPGRVKAALRTAAQEISRGFIRGLQSPAEE